MDARVASYLRELSRSRSGLNAAVCRAEGSLLIAEGKQYLDFYSGGGRFAYGHANTVLLRRLDDNLRQRGPIGENNARSLNIQLRFHSLFEQLILQPRDLPYQTHIIGPDAAFSIQAAIQLARDYTGRHPIVAFTEGHGRRQQPQLIGGHRLLAGMVFMPYRRSRGLDGNAMAQLELLFEELAAQQSLPAAVVAETVLGQGTGGVNVLTWGWLKDLARLCRRYGVLLIIDDSHTGAGRTGCYFSFEAAAVVPDMVVLGKGLSGLGVPLSLLLTAPGLEADDYYITEHWPSHFERDLALLTTAHALESYWADAQFTQEIRLLEALMRDWLENLVHSHAHRKFAVRGRGLMQGLLINHYPQLAQEVAADALKAGLVIETAGTHDEVLKLQPALTIGKEPLIAGLNLLEQSLTTCLKSCR